MDQLDYSNFPDFRTVQKRIKKLEEYNWPKYSISEGIDNFLSEIQKIL